MAPLSDHEAIESVVTDYFESWITGDAERMRGALHPELAKRAIAEGEAGSLELDVTTAADMYKLTKAGSGTRYAPGHKVKVFEVDGDMATAKLTCAPYVEYHHLARIGDRWLILNILWRPQEADAPAG